eukprot:TRINITY_DN1808_c1_g1_i8.p2 TRINITY_DN1808_c1_g1~~TRINITY_DN1808_c1_g1_i8.p2  ORF type:complete len:132 (-),score=4.11 TRINITY_DN1808_c1_g1_i8:769-1143(-)
MNKSIANKGTGNYTRYIRTLQEQFVKISSYYSVPKDINSYRLIKYIQWKQIILKKDQHLIVEALSSMLARFVAINSKTSVGLTNPSSKKIKAVTDLINQGAEIKKLYIKGRPNQEMQLLIKHRN